MRSQEGGSHMGTSQLSRRRFVQWGPAAAGATALVGFTGCASQSDDELSQTGGDAAAAHRVACSRCMWRTGFR